MRAEVRDAIESARTCWQGEHAQIIRRAEPARVYSFSTVRAVLLAVVRELPEEMSMRELTEELDIAVNQQES